MVMVVVGIVGIGVVGRGGDMGKEKGRIRIHQMQAGIGAIGNGDGGRSTDALLETDTFRDTDGSGTPSGCGCGFRRGV